MTVPIERTRAVRNTRRFLQSLANPRETPKVPRIYRRAAMQLLKHFPGEFDLQESARKAPETWEYEKEERTITQKVRVKLNGQDLGEREVTMTVRHDSCAAFLMDMKPEEIAITQKVEYPPGITSEPITFVGKVEESDE